MADADFFAVFKGIECVKPAAAAAVPEMDAENVDQISGVKVWECAMDLAKLLEEEFFAVGESGEEKLRERVHRRTRFRVLELGCGHAVPAIYFTKAWCQLAAGEGADVDALPELEVTLQDYASSVLEHITKRNGMRNLQGLASSAPESVMGPLAMQICGKRPGVDGTPSQEAAVKLEFRSGAWASMVTDPALPNIGGVEQPNAKRRRALEGDAAQAEGSVAAGHLGSSMTSTACVADSEEQSGLEQYDLILASECIYAEDPFEDLAQLLRKFLKPAGVAYFAAKRYYFGSGGGTAGFRKFLQDSDDGCKLTVETPRVIDDKRSNIREILEIRRASP